jgi:hypothetical protein
MKELLRLLILFGFITGILSCNESNSTQRAKPESMGLALTADTICTPADASSLDMTVIPQDETLWCWAACTEMIVEKLKDTIIRQCAEATRTRTDQADCCTSPDGCNATGWPDFHPHGLDSKTTEERALTMEEIKNQIDCNKAPIAYAINYMASEGGHMLVIDGYKSQNGTDSIFVLNPQGGGSYRLLSYAEYLSGYGYVHYKDIYDIKKQ